MIIETKLLFPKLMRLCYLIFCCIFLSCSQSWNIYRLFTVWEVRTEKCFPEVLEAAQDRKLIYFFRHLLDLNSSVSSFIWGQWCLLLLIVIYVKIVHKTTYGLLKNRWKAHKHLNWYLVCYSDILVLFHSTLTFSRKNYHNNKKR